MGNTINNLSLHYISNKSYSAGIATAQQQLFYCCTLNILASIIKIKLNFTNAIEHY